MPAASTRAASPSDRGPVISPMQRSTNDGALWLPASYGPPNRGSAPVLRVRSSCNFRSSVESQQILAVPRDHFGIAVAAGDPAIKHGVPIAGFGEPEQPVEILLIMRIRR